MSANEKMPSKGEVKTARAAQQRQAERRSNIMYAVIGVAFLLVAVSVFVWRSNIIQKSATAMSVSNGNTYNTAETSYYFNNIYQNFVSQNGSYLSYMGLDTSAPLREQSYGDETWFDFFLEQTQSQMAVIDALNDAAAADGFTWTADLQAQLDETMNTVTSMATSRGFGNVSKYLQQIYGPTMSVSTYKEQLQRTMLAEAYSKQYADSLQYSDAELTAAYEADPNRGDGVDYESVRISGAAPTTDADGNTVEVTDEMTANAMAAAKETATNIIREYRKGGDLSKLAEDNDGTYNSMENGSYSDSALQNWLFDSSRKAGDAAVVEDQDGSAYYVAVFHDRQRRDYDLINVRHILIQPETGEKTADEEGYAKEQAQLKADAEKKAADLLSQWQAGEATEDSFAALAEENSSDPGSASNGGLYEDVAPGDMVQPFNDWCFDSSRKPGDTGIVETDYGYHVMYYVGTDMPYWKLQARNSLFNEDYQEWYTGITDGYTAEAQSGMKYIG